MNHQSGAASGAAYYPLQPDDPLRIGDFWIDARLTSSAAGVAFSAHEDGGESVMVLLLSEGAAADKAARERFAGEINAMHIDTVVARGGQDQDQGRMAVRFRAEDDNPQLSDAPPLAPWAALAFTGQMDAVTEAERVLHAVDLAVLPPLGTPSGPDYSLHWSGNTGNGVTRLWPLPWPGRRDRAGWITFFTSWLLMMLLAALAILLAILLFQNAPMTSPPPPLPSHGEGSGGTGSESAPASGDQSQSSDPSSGEDSADPSEPGDQPPPSDDPSRMQPSGDESGPGEPSPNRRL